jgi:hypothetical protein
MNLHLCAKCTNTRVRSDWCRICKDRARAVRRMRLLQVLIDLFEEEVSAGQPQVPDTRFEEELARWGPTYKALPPLGTGKIPAMNFALRYPSA